MQDHMQTDKPSSHSSKDIPSNSGIIKGDSSRAHVNPLEKDACDFALNGRDFSQASSFSMPKDQEIEHGSAQSYGTGHSLSNEQQAKYSAILGYDFSDVRIYSDDAAAQAAEGIGATAFSKGNDIVFGKGELQTGGEDSERLLAHEMVHVAQFKEGKTGGKVLRSDKEGRGLGRTPPEGVFDAVESVGEEDSHVLFGMDSAELDGDDLESLRQELWGWPGPVVVDLYGYASLEGDDEYNLNLAAHRAMAVRDALYSMLPLGSRVMVHAFGETDHFGDPDQNRRVGFDVKPNLLFQPLLQLPSLPSQSTQPELSGLLPNSLPEDNGPNLSPFFTNPPSLRDDLSLDFGPMARSAGARGQALGDVFGDDIHKSYARMMGEMYPFLPPELRHSLIQMTLDSSVESHMAREHPNYMDQQNEIDARNGVSPTIVPLLNDEILQKMIEFFE